MSQKILFLVPYPLHQSPSQRFRFEQYFEILKKNGFEFSVRSFLNSHNWQLFFKSGKVINKVLALITGFSARFAMLFSVPFYNFVFIHREATPIGPPIFEWVIAKVLRKRIIYDFDDAIWLTDRSDESFSLRFLKFRTKVKSICKWSYHVSCGNEYLCSYARKFNSCVTHNPTTIDTLRWHNPDLFPAPTKRNNKLTVGWTGSHSTLKYLAEVEPALRRIEAKFPMIQILIIADRKPTLNLNSLSFIKWQEKTEIEDLLQVDIGIMPLPDDEWAKGKCGFKALQYMALRVPAVASSVGVNSKIIDNGVNGFLCNSPEAWELELTKLIENETLRKQIGEQGRKKVIDHYSILSNSDNFLSLFE